MGQIFNPLACVFVEWGAIEADSPATYAFDVLHSYRLHLERTAPADSPEMRAARLDSALLDSTRAWCGTLREAFASYSGLN